MLILSIDVKLLLVLLKGGSCALSTYLESLKISMLSSLEEPYKDIITLLCESWIDEAGNTEPQAVEEAFNYVERTKSRIFAEQLSMTHLGTTGIPDELVEEEMRLGRELKALQDYLVPRQRILRIVSEVEIPSV